MNIPSITTEQTREVDRLMVDEYGISLLQMMENAGRGLAELSNRMLGGNLAGKGTKVLAGGGMVVAPPLQNRGAHVHLKLAADPARLKSVPSRQWNILKAMGLTQDESLLEPADLVIDALLGYGLTSSPRPPVSDLVNWSNEQPARVLSLDAPSRLDTTSGTVYSPCVRAATTMTLAIPKTGLHAPGANPFVGELYLADISVPPELYQKAFGLQVPSLFAENSIIRV